MSMTSRSSPIEATYASNVIGLDALTMSTPGHSLRAVA